MFSNVLLGAMAFNNWADDGICYKDGIEYITFRVGGDSEDCSLCIVDTNKQVCDKKDNCDFNTVLGYFKTDDDFVKCTLGKDDCRYCVILGYYIDNECETVLNWMNSIKSEKILKMLYKKYIVDRRIVAEKLYAREPEKFIGMINRKNFTDVQKQEINKLIGEDVFEVNAQDKNDDETVTDEIPAEKQSQSMFQRVVKFGIKIFEVTKSITGWLLYNLLGVRFWY